MQRADENTGIQKDSRVLMQTDSQTFKKKAAPLLRETSAENIAGSILYLVTQPRKLFCLQILRQYCLLLISVCWAESVSEKEYGLLYFIRYTVFCAYIYV